MKQIIFMALISFVVTACATVDSLKRGSGRVFVVRGRDYPTVWRAANTVVSRQLAIVSVNKATGEIRAEKAAGLATWGEVIGIWITPPDPQAAEFTVEVLSLKRVRTQLTGQDWENTIVQGMKAELAVD
jgi:hypothetical protein